MIIDVANTNTIPLDVKDEILNEFSALPENIVSKIKNKQMEYKCDVLCAIEDYYGPFKAISFYNELIEILEKHEIICYHATKLYSKEDVLQYGLKTNDWDTYKYHLIGTYQKIALSQSDIEKAISIVEQEYKRKYLERISQLYSKAYSDSLKDDKNFNIVARMLIPLEECKRYCEEEAHRGYKKKYWRPITLKIAIA